MGSSLISIGVAVNQNRSIISDIDDLNNNSKTFGGYCSDFFNEDFLLESPTVKHKSADSQIKLIQKLLSNKSAKIGKIAKFKEKGKEEQQQEQPVIYSMVSQRSYYFFISFNTIHSLSLKPFHRPCNCVRAKTKLIYSV